MRGGGGGGLALSQLFLLLFLVGIASFLFFGLSPSRLNTPKAGGPGGDAPVGLPTRAPKKEKPPPKKRNQPAASVDEKPKAPKKPQIRGKQTPEFLHGDMIGKYMNGTLGWTPVPYMSAKQETMEMKRKAHKGNCFNLKRSDSLDLNRPVPDVRCKPCKDIQYDVSVLPNTSVVIVFFNEPLSTLYRSVHSVLNKAPPELLHENCSRR
eukprot:TRINITY_DN2403_c0_g1_i1.p1 TRINITY_DN2403_c0_g1~~TRINITY_DN2403_c0_g1_i1.p1  ORF type:complete len:242 (+),score=72.87 TRINITY_DN2403_c0_g1_i1:105-728(+)